MKRKQNRGGQVPSPATVSANEFTGALQKIYTDEEELKKFHAEYIGEDK